MARTQKNKATSGHLGMLKVSCEGGSGILSCSSSTHIFHAFAHLLTPTTGQARET